jgi:pyrrolidone-carboxylate peptidase
VTAITALIRARLTPDLLIDLRFAGQTKPLGAKIMSYKNDTEPNSHDSSIQTSEEPLMPIEPIDPPPPDPEPVVINQISPIAGALAGGIPIKLTGQGFQPGGEVYFGNVPATQVTYESYNVVHAYLPGSQTAGSVSVTLVNPDGSSDTVTGGFTYVATRAGEQAEVLGVSPLAVIENTETVVTLRGRNLIAAYNDGLVALRGPSRAEITFVNVSNSRDEASGIESLDITLRVTANPPLQPLERISVQVLASRRAGAANDGVVESSRQMFTVLPGSAPVPLAYTASLQPDQPSLVMVAGSNMEGCTLDVGDGATVHVQKGDDRFLSGVVTVSGSGTSNFAGSGPLQLSLLDSSGNQLAQYPLEIASVPYSNSLAPSPNGGLDVSFSAVPDQQFIGPTENDNAVFSVNGASASSFIYDWWNFEITILDISIILPIINEVYLIPFFDGGGDLNSPVLAQVGKLFRVRGTGLLVALRVEVVIHIRVVLIIGFIYDIWPFGLYNEFPEYGWSLGSVVIGVRIEIEITLIFSFLIALVKPGGELEVIVAFNLTAGIDFSIDSNGRLHFDPNFDHQVRIAGISPVNNLQPCGGRFQIAEENGQTAFLDAQGGYQSFYFARSAGDCCLPWDFNMELVRFSSGGVEEVVQQRFQANYCLTAQPAQEQFNVIITSVPPPEGVPPTLVMDIADTALLKALAQPVDSNGNPTGAPAQDLRDLGYDVEFFLQDPLQVLDPEAMKPGNAFAILEGNNIIRAAVTSEPVVGEASELAFWHGSILGFDIIRHLAEGRPPRLRTGGLPVTVNQLTEIRVEPTLAYYDEQGNLQPSTVIERYEPHEVQREYVLAAKVTKPRDVTTDVTVRFPSVSFLMRGKRNGNFINDAPLRMPDNPQFPGNRGGNSTVGSFFTGSLANQAELSLKIPQGADLSKLIPFDNAGIKPNQFEDGVNLVPPGSKVTDKEVVLNIKLSNSPTSTSGHGVKVSQTEFDLAVQNDETYEEYYRVFKEIRELMQQHSGRGSTSLTLGNFAERFHSKLKQVGLSQPDLRSQGQALWELGYKFVQTTRKDDRMLYYARLESLAVLRAFCKRQKPSLTLSPENLNIFEWSSRGLETSDGRSVLIKFEATSNRKVIVTGYDPFLLDDGPTKSNTSGLIALDFHNKTSGSTASPATVKTAVLPVRFRDFDEGLIEKIMGQGVKDASMILTCSWTGSPYYNIDRFPTRYRTKALHDNEHRYSATDQPSGMDIVTAPFYLETTLPYNHPDVLWRDRKVIGPSPATAPADTFLVLNQSYKLLSYTGTAEDPGKYRADPVPGTEASYLPKEKPNNEEVGRGSGGSYLSNEIFYRTANVRRVVRPQLATGHLHVPPLGSISTEPDTLGGGLLKGMKIILDDFLKYAFPLSGAEEISFAETPINSGGSFATLSLANPGGSPAPAVISAVEFSSPSVQLSNQLPITIGTGTSQSIQFKFNPTEARDYSEAAILKAADGAVLYKVMLKGKGVVREPRIFSFSPESGPAGTLLTITGENFTGATGVKFGGVSASFTINSNTQITATVPSGAVSSAIEVVTPAGGATSSGQFTVLHPPSIYTFQPSYGGQYSTVTVYGENLDGAYAVRMGGYYLGITSGSSTQVSAMVSAPPGYYSIEVDTPNGTVTTENVGYFHVTSEYGGGS